MRRTVVSLVDPQMCRCLKYFVPISSCVSAAACTNHVPVITTLLRGGETQVFILLFIAKSVETTSVYVHVVGVEHQ